MRLIDADDLIKAFEALDLMNGKWCDYQEGNWIYAKCSLCGAVQDSRSNFCPNCGAKMTDDLISRQVAIDALEGRNNMCIENLFRCLSCDCPVDIYQDSILLYTGDAYDIPIGLMNANIKEIKPGKNEHLYDPTIEIILAG